MYEFLIGNVYEFLTGIMFLWIANQNFKLNKKINNTVIIEKAIHPIYYDIVETQIRLSKYKDMYHNVFIGKVELDEYKYQEFIRTPNVERFRNLLIQCEIYLDKNSYNMILEYELDINRFFLQHMLIEDCIHDGYAYECLPIDEAYILFDDLLATIKIIKERYN